MLKLRRTETRTRQAVYVSRNIELRSANPCRGKPINITFSECVSVALVMPACKSHAPYYIAVCGLSYCYIFPHCLINGAVFGVVVGWRGIN